MVNVEAWKQQLTANAVQANQDLFEVLGLTRSADTVAVRRAYKTLISKEHPDKGGNPERFKSIKLAYDTLSDTRKREYYEATGKISRSAGEDFLDKFRGGKFGEYSQQQQQERRNLAEAITTVQSHDQSHTAGFEAWMRSRGENGTSVFTAETMAEKFGVNKGSYDPIPIPKAATIKVVVEKPGGLKKVTRLISEVSSGELEWGQVLVGMKYAPVDSADIYTVSMGLNYGEAHSLKMPCVAGNRGFGVILKVGPGVKRMREDDWVIPLKGGLGTWQSLLVVKASDVIVLPKECMPFEYASLSHQLCLALRLLEDFGNLKPGECVILNAATSTVGQILIQLCYLLNLRTVAVVSDHDDLERTSTWLKSLGATHILADKGSVKVQLEQLKFFGKPKLALDAVGGASAGRIADALVEVKGFNFGAWMSTNVSKVPGMMEALGKLIKADQLRIAFTEYEMATEFEEALDHALDRGTNTKALLKLPELVLFPDERDENMGSAT